jgi:hypothetical protein
MGLPESWSRATANCVLVETVFARNGGKFTLTAPE